MRVDVMLEVKHKTIYKDMSAFLLSDAGEWKISLREACVMARVVFPLRDWHTNQMKAVVSAYLDAEGGSYEGLHMVRQLNSKRGSYYTSLDSCCHAIEYDMKHGVTKNEVLIFLGRLRNHTSLSKVYKKKNIIRRIKELEMCIAAM
jgi:hypothetical protein